MDGPDRAVGSLAASGWRESGRENAAFLSLLLLLDLCVLGGSNTVAMLISSNANRSSQLLLNGDDPAIIQTVSCEFENGFGATLRPPDVFPFLPTDRRQSDCLSLEHCGRKDSCLGFTLEHFQCFSFFLYFLLWFFQLFTFAY